MANREAEVHALNNDLNEQIDELSTLLVAGMEGAEPVDFDMRGVIPSLILQTSPKADSTEHQKTRLEDSVQRAQRCTSWTGRPEGLHYDKVRLKADTTKIRTLRALRALR
jgi:hypothetical protein